MKKTLLLALAALTLASCSQELSPVQVSTDRHELAIKPLNGALTRAAINGTTFPTGRTMVMAAYYNAVTGDSGNYFSNSSFAYRSAVSLWGGVSPKYWPLSGSLDLFAYSVDGLTPTSQTYETKVSEGVTLGIPDNATVQCDILHSAAASQTRNPAGNPMQFKHAQALVTFKAKTNVERNTTDNAGITINSITLKDAKYSGTLAISSEADPTDGYCVWSSLGSQADKNLPLASAYDVPTGSFGPSHVFGIGQTGILVPEQDQTRFIINYTLHNGKDDANNAVNNTMQYEYVCSGGWEEGKKYVYNIDITLNEILIAPTVLDWDAVEAELVPIPAPKIAGLQIAAGPLYYNGTAYEIKDGWNFDSYNSVYGKASGSYYFNFIEMGQLFEKVDFSGSDGNIENLLDPFSGWRLPTQAEWASICGTTRAGSSVNGSAGKHYALVKLTGVTHAGFSTPNGLLIFPDGATITGKALSGMDNTTQTTGVTLEELNAYLAQGCAFLPASGGYGEGDWYSGGRGCGCWSSTEGDEYGAYYLYFDDGHLNPGYYDYKSGFYYSVRLVRE